MDVLKKFLKSNCAAVQGGLVTHILVRRVLPDYRTVGPG